MKKQAVFEPIRIQIDRFHNPVDIRTQKGALSPQGFFYDSFDYPAIIKNVIEPVKKGKGKIVPGCFDYRSETAIKTDEIPVTSDSIILFDGIFMNRDELTRYWDLSIFLDVSFDTVLKRALIRDTAYFGNAETVKEKYLNRYIPGEKIYLDSCHPMKRADIVIDNNDYHHPIIVKKYPGKSL